MLVTSEKILKDFKNQIISNVFWSHQTIFQVNVYFLVTSIYNEVDLY